MSKGRILFVMTVLMLATLNANRINVEPTKEEKQGFEFLIGFIEGFGGPGTEPIESCENIGKDITGEIKKLVNIFKNHNLSSIIDGVQSLIDLVKEAPQTFKDCEKANSALEVYKNKSKRFNNIATLALKITKNAIAHQNDMFRHAAEGVDYF